MTTEVFIMHFLFTENENITDRQFIQTTYKFPFQILQYELNSFPGLR